MASTRQCKYPFCSCSGCSAVLFIEASSSFPLCRLCIIHRTFAIMIRFSFGTPEPVEWSREGNERKLCLLKFALVTKRTPHYIINISFLWTKSDVNAEQFFLRLSELWCPPLWSTYNICQPSKWLFMPERNACSSPIAKYMYTSTWANGYMNQSNKSK